MKRMNITVEFARRPAYPRLVALIRFLVILGLLNGVVLAGQGASARLVKVLPHFVDQQGRVALNPSLYERDAYQAHLRAHPTERGGLRFDVQWKSREVVRLTLRVELRGNRGKEGTSAVLEESVTYHGLLSAWSKVSLTGEAYAKFGELSAWRATLWDGDKLISEQESFLW